MMKTAIILATGPSLTNELISIARAAQLSRREHFTIYGMNHIWRDFPSLDVFMSCNPEYYRSQWNRGLCDIPAKKWTWDIDLANDLCINFIQGIWEDGFSTDPGLIHYGHSSGFQVPQIAYHDGCRRMLLLGYDMKYAPNYDGRQRIIGSSPRHYFGEYSSDLQHWPSVKVKHGVHFELIEQFEKVKEINRDIEIINCSPGSAMTCFPMGDLRDFV